MAESDKKSDDRWSQKDQAAFKRSMSLEKPYTLGPDSMAQDGVPRGQIIQHHWESTQVYPGTERDYWLYVPQQYDGEQPTCLMVFQDGELYLGPDINVPVVFDNLIHQRVMPVTVGLSVNPGRCASSEPGSARDSNRSCEYDSLGDQYARFLLDELPPEIEKLYRIVPDPAGRAICGTSSGGICAFTVAWERPDAFRKVISHCGSFTNMRGGHNYPTMVRKAAAKPIRVFLQSGANDLDIVCGS